MKQAYSLQVFILLLLAAACKGPEAKQGNTPPDTPLVVNTPPASSAMASNIVTTADYEIAIPQGWVRKDRVSGAYNLVMLVAPRADNYSPNLNVLRDNMNGKSLDGYIRTNLEKMATMNLKDQRAGDMSINGVHGKYLTYSYQIEGREISIKTYVVPKDGFAFVLTASCLLSQSATYMPQFDKLADTFKLK
ncbi:hypothetical protein [Mucilaginibacter sp.]|uniref:hypothetical protein n=1 Tax=Mucilaginibacter sp. TaxID=1882438 RepID=UPI0035BBC721